MMPELDYLVVAPHPDDAELGVGGTILLLKAQGFQVGVLDLTDAARFWAKLTKSDLPGEPHFPQRILYYFSVHLRTHPRPAFVLDVSDHFEGKMRAVACYRSQFIEGRPATPPTLLDDLRDRARYWGWAIGVGYGEPFVCREEIGLRGLRDLT